MFDTLVAVVNVVTAHTYLYIAFSLALPVCMFFVFIFFVRCVFVYVQRFLTAIWKSVCFHCCCCCEPFQSVHSWKCVFEFRLGVCVLCVLACWMLCAGLSVFILLLFSYSIMMCVRVFGVRVSLCVSGYRAVRVAKQREQVVCFGVVQRFSWTKQLLRHRPAFSSSTTKFNSIKVFAVSSHHLTKRRKKTHRSK